MPRHHPSGCQCGAPDYAHEIFEFLNEIGEIMTGIQSDLDADTAAITALSGSVDTIISGIDALKTALNNAGVPADTSALDAALVDLKTKVDAAVADVAPVSAPAPATGPLGVPLPPAESTVSSTDPASVTTPDPGSTPEPVPTDHPDDSADPTAPAVVEVAPASGTTATVGDDGVTTLSSTGQPATADTAPAAPAVVLAILEPLDGAVYATAAVQLSGTSDVDGSVVIYDGDATIGTASAASGVWSATVTLTDGDHDLWVGTSTTDASAHIKVTVDTTN